MKLFKPLVSSVLFVILFISCKKNENTGGAADASGSFIGRVKYQGNSIEVDRDNRLIRVLRDGTDTYKIEFFTGIPNIQAFDLIKPMIALGRLQIQHS